MTASRTKETMILFFVDAEKAFDREEWVFIKTLVEIMGLGDQLILRTEAVSDEPNAKLSVTIHYSDVIIHLRQGSPYLL